MRSSRGKGVGSVETDRAGKTCVETEKMRLILFNGGVRKAEGVKRRQRNLCVVGGP